MKFNRPTLVEVALLAVLATVAIPQTVQAQQVWNALLGAQSKDMGKQAIAFLPNELWIHAGDSITWTSASGDIHTVTFLIAGQQYADFTVGCPGFSPSGSSFDGTTCVTAPPLVAGQSFTVTFPVAGNYQLVCLVHSHMTGVVHVLDASAILPHDQEFYNEQAEKQQRALLTDTDREKNHSGDHDMRDMLSARVLSGKKSVAAGIGEMAATGAGFQSLSVVRFLNQTIQIHAGDTVEWTNLDPALPHTITFGTPPANPGPPSANVTVDADGALHATITSTGDNVHSGIIVAAPQDQLGVPQSPPGVTRFRVTFKQPGTYDYECELHDNLGMVGKVIVRP
jgi:plastocyanin